MNNGICKKNYFDDLQAAQLSFNTVQDLKQVRQVASSRKEWAKISQKIVERLKLKALDDIKRTTARAAVKRKERVGELLTTINKRQRIAETDGEPMEVEEQPEEAMDLE